jgi:hypothetical protein
LKSLTAKTPRAPRGEERGGREGRGENTIADVAKSINLFIVSNLRDFLFPL